MKKHFYLFAFALVALFCATACSSDDDEKLDPAMDSSQFVLISEHIPDVILEIRYNIICIDIMAKHSSVFTQKRRKQTIL